MTKEILFLLLWSISLHCNPGDTAPKEEQPPANPTAEQAAVISVDVSGEPGAYTFRVGIRSPDTGCDQYADWWEVIGQDSSLKYRRILAHSHVDEQPFVRSGGPVAVPADEPLWIRAHMNNLGYGSLIYTGSVEGGFQRDTAGHNFASGLASQPPLPEDCAF